MSYNAVTGGLLLRPLARLDSKQRDIMTVTPSRPPDRATSGQSAPGPQTKKNSPHRILLVDDDALIVDALDQILRVAGHEVHSCTRGTELFRLLELLRPDLVITDIIMSDIDTIDTIAQVRRIQPELKIIAISGNPHLLTLATRHGADKVLAKPFDVHKISRLVKTTLQYP